MRGGVPSESRKSLTSVKNMNLVFRGNRCLISVLEANRSFPYPLHKENSAILWACSQCWALGLHQREHCSQRRSSDTGLTAQGKVGLAVTPTQPSEHLSDQACRYFRAGNSEAVEILEHFRTWGPSAACWSINAFGLEKNWLSGQALLVTQ